MEDYKSNSDKARQEQQSEKKVEAVITGAAKTRKKGEMQKFADVFIAEDANNVKSYILMEVIVPAVKKAISDIVTTGIDMILYGRQLCRFSGLCCLWCRNQFQQITKRRFYKHEK